MKKVLGIMLFLTLTISYLAGCGGGSSSPTEAPSSGTVASTQEADSAVLQPGGEADYSKLKLGHATTPLGDRGQIDAIKQGLDRFVGESGCEYSMVESSSPEDLVQGARDFAQAGFDIVILTLSLDGVVAEFAAEYPNTQFLINFGTTGDVPNITSVDMLQNQMAFLCGAFNALMNKELGGVERSAMVAPLRGSLDPAVHGFMAGARWVGCEPTVAYTGDFNDPAKGKEVALQLYNEGLRVVWGFAGITGQGVFSAADSMPEGYYCMGGADGQFDLSERMIASTIQDNSFAYYNFVWQIARGELRGGFTEISLRGGSCDFQISPLHGYSELVPQYIQDTIAELKERIINGEITPPANIEEYNKFVLDHNL